MTRPPPPLHLGIASASATGAANGSRNGSTDRAYPTVFLAFLSLFVGLTAAKVHEVFPPLAGLPVVKIVGGIFLLMAAARLDRGDLKALLRAPTARWISVIVILAVVSTPFSLWPGFSFEFLTTQLWQLVVLFAVVGAAAVDPRTRMVVIKAFAASAAIVALRMLAGGTQSVSGRVYAGSTFDPNESALLLVVAIPFAVGLASRSQRWLWIGLAVVCALAAAMTGSRGGLLGLAALSGQMIYRAAPRRRLLYVVGIAGAASILYASVGSDTKARLSTVFSMEQDYNASDRDGRIAVWKRGVGYMVQRPLLGVGVSCFPIAEGVMSGKLDVGFGVRYTAAHNSFVQVGAELGVLGLIAFCAALWTARRACISIPKRPSPTRGPDASHSNDLHAMAVATESALVAFVVTGFFLSFAYQMVTFLLFALAAGIHVDHARVAHAHPRPRAGRGPQRPLGLRRVPLGAR